MGNMKHLWIVAVLLVVAAIASPKTNLLIGFHEKTKIALKPGDKVLGGVVQRYWPELHVALVIYPSNTGVSALIEKIKKDPRVEFAEPDWPVSVETR